MQIYDLLIQDHEELKQLLSELIEVDEDDEDLRDQLIDEIQDALVPHSRAEERVLYNAIREADVDKKIAWDGYKEHAEAEVLLRVLQAKDKMNLDWKETAIKLRDALEHHIAEEESRYFSEARKLLTPDEARMMGEAFQRLKEDVQDNGMIRNALEMAKNLMPPRLSRSLGMDQGSPRA